MPTNSQREIVKDMFLSAEERKIECEKREEWLSKFKEVEAPDWTREITQRKEELWKKK